MNIINDNTFNLHDNHLNNDNRNMKVTVKSKLTGFLFWPNILNDEGGIKKIYSVKKSAPYMPSNTISVYTYGLNELFQFDIC